MNGDNIQQSLSNQEIQSALQTTMQMLRSDDVKTPNSWNNDLANMEKMILGMLSGQLRIIPAGPPEGAQPPAGPTTGNMPPEIPPPAGDGDAGSGKPN